MTTASRQKGIKGKTADRSPAMPQRVALYARVSTEDQAERQTVQGQLDFLRRYCDLHQLPITGEYVDEGWSGTVELDQRPDGKRLLDDAAAGAFGTVLVYRLDRLGRSLKALLTAHDALDDAGIAIRSTTEPFDTGSPIGRFVFQLLGSIAELERESIKERTTMGRDRVAKTGRYVGGVVPVGYDVRADSQLVPSARLVPQLETTEAEMVRELFQRVANGSTAVMEARRLTALGITPMKRYGNGKALNLRDGWSQSTLLDIIHNPAYKGTAMLRSRNGLVERPMPALVDDATWDAAQAGLVRNRKVAKRNAVRSYLLRGLIRCENCGLTYIGSTFTRGEYEYRFYRCNGQVKPELAADRCRGRAVAAEEIETLVWNDIQQWAHEPEVAIAEAQAQLGQRHAQTAGVEEKRRRLLAELAEKEAERERVLTMYRRGRITADEAERELESVAHETATLRELVESMRAQQALAAAHKAHLTDAMTMLLQLRELVDDIDRTNDQARKREVMDLLVSRIGIHTESVAGRVRRKPATVSLRYHFGPPRTVAAEHGNASGTTDYYNGQVIVERVAVLASAGQVAVRSQGTAPFPAAPSTANNCDPCPNISATLQATPLTAPRVAQPDAGSMSATCRHCEGTQRSPAFGTMNNCQPCQHTGAAVQATPA